MTLGLRGPVELVRGARDLSPEEQDAIVNRFLAKLVLNVFDLISFLYSNKEEERCSICSADFGFLLRPHRCGACARLVCSKDSASHISSDLLALSDAWVCTGCHPQLVAELKQKVRY